MSVIPSVADVLDNQVVLTVESLDRVDLSVRPPRWPWEKNAAAFFLYQRGVFFTKVMARMTRDFVGRIAHFADEQKVPLITFDKKSKPRKENLAAEFRAKLPVDDGVLFIGQAQEKAHVPRVTTPTSNTTGRKMPWLAKSSAMVKHYDFYCVDEDCGPLFSKFCSDFPDHARLCLNGHEDSPRQLEKAGLAFQPLENGGLRGADPQRWQKICDGLTQKKIPALWKKWEARRPQPFRDADRRAGYGSQLFLQPVEFSRTPVLDRPRSGRLFFEQMLRDNLDLGRPNQRPRIFDQRIPRTTKTQFRTRLITEPVIPSLWLDDKRSSIKPYFQEERAWRTELTVNNTRDFRLGKALSHLAALRQVAFAANRRLLHVPQLSHDPTRGDDEFRTLTTPQVVAGQRVSGLRFGDTTVLAVLTALLMFRHLPNGFTNSALRQSTARRLARPAQEVQPGQMTYHLRRLRVRGLIVRLPKTNRYQLTDSGQRAALFYVTSLSRVIRPTATELADPTSAQNLLRRIAKAMTVAKT